MKKGIILVAFFVHSLMLFSQEVDGGWFRLVSKVSNETCLEGSKSTSAVRGGSSYMDKFLESQGQVFKFEKQANGYYLIKSKGRGENECFEGTEANDPVRGSVFMNTIDNSDGQLWKITSAGAGTGYFRLENKLLENKSLCLDGNITTNKAHGGSAFMAKIDNMVNSQWWKLVLDGPAMGFMQGKVVTYFLNIPNNPHSYLLDDKGIVWENTNKAGTWVKIGEKCQTLIFDGKNLISFTVDKLKMQYLGTANNWKKL